MASSISNTVQSTNPMAGLLGLTPKPKVASGVQTTTPAIAQKPPQSNFGSLLGAVGNGISAVKGIIPNAIGNVAKLEGNLLAGGAKYLAAPAGTSYAQANPTQPFQYSPLLPQGQAANNTPGNFTFPEGQDPRSQPTAPQSPAPTQKLGTATPQPNATASSTPNLVNPNLGIQTAGFGNGAPTIAPPAPLSPPTTSKGLFPDVVGSLAGIGKGGSQDVRNATENIKALQNSFADENNRISTSVYGAGDLGGQRGIAERLYTAKLGAAQTGLSNALQGQSQQISALNSAASQSAPSVTSYGQTSFDPVTGSFGQGGNGGLPAEVMQQYAQMAATGQYLAIPSFITSNPVLNAQLNVAAKAVNPSYTPIGAQGASGVLGSIPAMQSANTAAEGIKNTIVSYLQSNPGLNPSDFAAGNKIQQWIEGKQLTDPKYQVLANYLNEYTNTLAPILGVGGDPTNLKTQIAASFINAAASGQSIAQVLDSMSSLATNKIQDLQSGATGGGTTVPTPTGSFAGSGGTGGFAEAW